MVTIPCTWLGNLIAGKMRNFEFELKLLQRKCLILVPKGYLRSEPHKINPYLAKETFFAPEISNLDTQELHAIHRELGKRVNFVYSAVLAYRFLAFPCRRRLVHFYSRANGLRTLYRVNRPANKMAIGELEGNSFPFRLRNAGLGAV